MTRFVTSLRAHDVLDAPLEEIWAVLRDRELLAELTPLIDHISMSGDDDKATEQTWQWCLTGVTALGITAAPCFTEKMRFEGMGGITFVHDPPASDPERAGAAGRYVVTPDPDGGTHLQINLTVNVELPLPRLMAKPVERVMQATLRAGGERFASNLVSHLGGVKRRGMVVTKVDDAEVTAVINESSITG